MPRLRNGCLWALALVAACDNPMGLPVLQVDVNLQAQAAAPDCRVTWIATATKQDQFGGSDVLAVDYAVQSSTDGGETWISQRAGTFYNRGTVEWMAPAGATVLVDWTLHTAHWFGGGIRTVSC
jgi:hypothetical protein